MKRTNINAIVKFNTKIPQGIFSSCANLFAFQTKYAKDRDLILPHLGKSEQGMVNT